MAQTSPNTPAPTQISLGPFIGDITSSSVKLWLSVDSDVDKDVFVTVRPVEHYAKAELGRQVTQPEATPQDMKTEVVQSGVIHCLKANLGTGTATLAGLEPNTKYSYQLWADKENQIILDLGELEQKYLWFITLPEEGYEKQLDFLLMSCHNPQTATSDDCEGFGVWRQLPEIMKQNANVRFALLAGDQIYADEVEALALKERDPDERRQLYLGVYKRFWNNKYYRSVLCSLPAVLMWDDHDITDGWGSREDSFRDDDPQEFRPEWKELLETAKSMFALMQAARNPEPLSKDFETGFDTCFKVGKAGFIVADLRSNRNLRKRRIWNPEQLEAIKAWVAANKSEMETLFFVSSVVFSHGSPQIETKMLGMWFRVLQVVKLVEKSGFFRKKVALFNSKFGDLRDDINDSWGSDYNRAETDRVLDYLFDVENPVDEIDPLNVVILSGDIHTPGYSTIYSKRSDRHKKAVIPHIVATPVSYEPFSWIGEAIFRRVTKVVKLGNNNNYTSQVSHHFCYRNVVVVSLRNYSKEEDEKDGKESYLKVKYYLEGFPEPQIMLFDLNHGARKENIDWPTVPAKKQGRFGQILSRLAGISDVESID
jgi:phosphodiesterase/alkaline phosphatase D-like protein